MKISSYYDTKSYPFMHKDIPTLKLILNFINAQNTDDHNVIIFYPSYVLNSNFHLSVK